VPWSVESLVVGTACYAGCDQPITYQNALIAG